MRDAGYQAEISNGASLGNAGFIVVAISTSPKWDSPSGVAYMRRHLIPGLHPFVQISLWCGLCVWNAMSGLGQRRRSWIDDSNSALPPEGDFGQNLLARSGSVTA